MKICAFNNNYYRFRLHQHSLKDGASLLSMVGNLILSCLLLLLLIMFSANLNLFSSSFCYNSVCLLLLWMSNANNNKKIPNKRKPEWILTAATIKSCCWTPSFVGWQNIIVFFRLEYVCWFWARNRTGTIFGSDKTDLIAIGLVKKVKLFSRF